MADHPFPLSPQPSMRGSYSTLVFISHLDHLKDLDVGDSDTLIVASDWLVWRRCVERGDHCLHFETGVVEGAPANAERDDFFITADGWVYGKTGDMTIFEDVSIGKMFTRETSLFLLSYFQLQEGLGWFCRTYGPTRLVLYDIRTEFGLVDETLKVRLASAAAGDAGAEFVNHLQAPPADCPDFAFFGDYMVRPVFSYKTRISEKMRDLLRHGYSMLVEVFYGLRWLLAGGKKRILLLPTGLMLKGLLKHYDPGLSICPMLIAERESKKWADLKNFWRCGVYLARMPYARLTRQDKKRIEKIRHDLAAYWRKPGGNLDEAVRHYVTNHIFVGRRIEDMCTEVKRVSRFLKYYKPVRVVVSNTTNPGTRDFIESAYRKNIPVDFLPHGPFISKQKHDALTGDDHTPFMISMFLGWGDQAGFFARQTGVKSRFVKTGYPVHDVIRDRKLEPAAFRGNALILPYVVESQGFVNFSSIIYSWLIDMAEMVHDHGYKNIRVKIHPGAIFNKSYYEQVFSYTDVPVEVIHTDEPLIDHLKWADIVAGPVHSGAFLETLMAGRPYYPFLIPPHPNDEGSLKGVPFFKSVRDFGAALEKDYSIDPDLVLNHFCGIKDIKNPSANFWATMNHVSA